MHKLMDPERKSLVIEIDGHLLFLDSSQIRGAGDQLIDSKEWTQ